MNPGGQALVIGATGSVGGAVLRRLRKEGLTVVAVARSAETLQALSAADPGVIACPADIGAEDCGERIASSCGEVGRPVRVVVQAAGLPASGPLWEVNPAALGTLVSLKLGGLLRAVRAVDPLLQAGSRIIAIGGHYGSEPSPRTCGAGVTNAALANLVRQLADHYGPRGVTAHLIAPGPLDTERLRRIAAAEAETRDLGIECVLDEYRRHSPLGRLTEVAEVAWAIAVLLAPEAAALHGATLALDSGARHGLF
ncbi:SDR family NAD(P)-dependent oxidoreductase [Pseudonocardia sp. RS010]|uniref:SDR family NAD(P)-dependent oxidoreductase n=1 Tax=Pseudonocardia sp. RS010 TaxID=3385979 RepID=UPI0039A0050A